MALRIPSSSVARALLLAACGLTLAGCWNAGYLLEQARGQLDLFRRRQRIADLLRRADLPRAHRAKLELVLLTREYASEVIGLARTPAYTRFVDTGGRPVAYNVSAAPKDALRPHTWTFPIVGRLPYLGFFELARARAVERDLRRRGLDTYLRPVAAYSSLGWFADPVYSTMLEATPERIVDLVIHESTHATVFLRGEVGFNESLAVFVGQQGTIDLFSRLFGPRAPLVARARRRFRRKRRFGQLIASLYRRLSRLYASARPRQQKLRARQRLFRWAKTRYRQLFPDPALRGGFLRRPLNNAIVLSYGRYLQGLRFHQQVYRHLGRRLSALVTLYRHAQHLEAPIEHVARRCGLRRPPPQRM